LLKKNITEVGVLVGDEYFIKVAVQPTPLLVSMKNERELNQD